jgi:hypothetical protein
MATIIVVILACVVNIQAGLLVVLMCFNKKLNAQLDAAFDAGYEVED